MYLVSYYIYDNNLRKKKNHEKKERKKERKKTLAPSESFLKVNCCF